jgi:hypothetical protein
MSYQASEGSTFASLSLTGAPLLGAVGCYSHTQYAIPATASATSAIVFSKVLPKGTWIYSATGFPSAAAGQVIETARIDVGYNYPAAPTYLSSFLSLGGHQGLEMLTSGAYFSDGLTPLQVVISATTNGGTWSGIMNTTNQMTLVKVA